MGANGPLLRIENLHVSFFTLRGVVRAVRGLDLEINAGETVALVGESGCGKSVSAHSITGLLPKPPAEVEQGTIHFDGQDLLKLSDREMGALRGDRISMIFQEPMTSLNPVFKIGDQIADVFHVHHKINKRQAHDRAVELLDKVKIPDPERRASEYPHQLSGGMRQRAMIAMALASPNPASSSRTSPRLPWMSQSRPRFCISSMNCRKTPGWRCCSSRMTWVSWRRWLTGLRSCTLDAPWNRAA